MIYQEFWKKLDYQLVIYFQLVEENMKEMTFFSKNQNKSERQQYEDELERFIQLKNFYDIIYLNSK